MILRELKKTAEDYLGEKVERAVITVPAYFNDSQRHGHQGGRRDRGAQGRAHHQRAHRRRPRLRPREEEANEKIAVFDFGGGTFDVSILDVGEGVFEVLSTNGDTHLGGDDVDQILIDYIAEEFRKEEGIDLRDDADGAPAPQGGRREGQVRALDQPDGDHRHQPARSSPLTRAGPKHLQQTDHPRQVRALCEGLFDRLRKPCEQALKDAGSSQRA